ncbi:hypothetical protein AGMMS49982_02100 [Bacteroidia bacterium]|nr:hypothetical protein AGMMS49982_02100 [Bacteroidia bacterium]
MNRNKIYIVSGFAAIVIGLLCALQSQIFHRAVTFYWELGFVIVLYINEIYAAITVSKKRATVTSQQMVTVYMALKFARLVLLLVAVILAYVVPNGIEPNRFTMVAGVVYCLYLALNTFMLVVEERQILKHKEDSHRGLDPQVNCHRGLDPQSPENNSNNEI